VTAYGYADGLVSRDARAARLALRQGLDDLRDAMREMWSVAIRGDGARSVRSRSATDAPVRHLPGRQPGPHSKPLGGRTTPVRSPVSQPVAHPDAEDAATAAPDTDTAVIPAAPDTDTAVIPAVPADTVVLPVVPAVDEPGSDFPDRPDPSDPATEVWNLVERAKAGDAEAFGLIYDRYLDTVFRFVYFRVGNRQLAEDLTSETFLRALKRLSSFTWQGRDLGAWLVTIARNLVADHFKSGRYRLEVTTGDVLDAEREDRGPEGSPEAAVVDHITNVTLLTAVKQLNPEQQECIVLRFLQGFSVAETARAMGKNEGAIKALQYRAVRALHRLLPEGFQA
jgi:RNA polymerase sigma-70 factor (ECF subfamily)